MSPFEAQLAAVLDLLSRVLGAGLRGVYLYGSATSGGLRPASDIDLLAVVGRPSTAAERRALVAGLRPLSSRAERPVTWRPVELTGVVADEVKPWRYPPTMDFQHGEWLRAGFDRGELPAPGQNPDLAVLLTMVRDHGRTLFGPPAEALLDPVPSSDLRRAIRDSLPGLMRDVETDTANVLLTLARMWLTLATGRIASKAEAADWALEGLPPERRSALARARAAYAGGAEDVWQDLQVVARADARQLMALVEQAARTGTETCRR